MKVPPEIVPDSVAPKMFGLVNTDDEARTKPPPVPTSSDSDEANEAEVIDEAAVPYRVPEVGRVTLVVPVVVRVRLCAPERMKLLAPIVYVLGSTGVPVRVGELAKTAAPVPVSSDRRAASWAEVEKEFEKPNDDVATH